jgi:lactose/L-arabinose transport system substrate-binding protein
MTRITVLKKILFLLVLSAMIFSACQPAAPTAQPQPPAQEPAAPASPAEPAVQEPAPASISGNMLIWVQQANQDVFEQTGLPDFQGKYPGVSIDWVNYPPADVASQMVLAIQGGAGGPDIGITENASIGRLVELGGLMDLTDRLAPYRNQLNDFALQEGSKDGRNYCVPWDIGPVVTFYRRDIFEAAGFSSEPDEVSKLVATWDTYLDTCRTIKEETGVNCFALNKANNYGDYFFNMTWSRGMGLYTDDGNVLVDGPEYVAALEKLGEFWNADLVSDNLEWTDSWYAELNASIDDPVVKPVATIVIAAWMGNFLKTWIAPDQAGNWGVALMPAWQEGGIRSANQGGSCAFIPESSTNPEAAWAFIEDMLLDTDNHVKIFEYSDYFPAYEATYDHTLFGQPDPYFGDQVTRSLFAEVAQEIPIANQYGPYSQAVRGAVATAIQEYAMGQRTAESALREAAATIRIDTDLR